MRSSYAHFCLAALVLALGAMLGLIDSQGTSAQTTSGSPVPRATPPDDGTIPPPPPPLPTKDDTPLVIDTELVNLNVKVVDRFNRPIANLNKAEFTVYEDGKPQPIEFFSQDEVPTNYALVIDNSGSLRFQLEKVIESSKIIVGTNRPDDETGVVRFVSSSKIEILQDFTTDKQELYDALDNMYIEGGKTAIIDAVYLAAEKVDEYQRSLGNDDRRRRALILVSDGEDRDSYYKEEQLFDLLREADVQIYTVGFINELDKDGGFIRKSPQKQARSFLEKLAEETGGKSYFPNDLSELNGIARDIANELRTQYSIGYLPDNTKPDGTYRNIRVVVKDGPNDQKRIAITRTGLVVNRKDTPGPELRPANR
ncbi:MAG: VWA domain-containing protein [Acidobacteriota bacterium]|nr:MAG: VWA domain-containing protein [Acidobacteriota bacterium]